MKITLDNKRELNDIKNMFTLIYSAKAAERYGSNHIIDNDGKETEYTCMHDEAKLGKWELSYLWDDAVVVGYADDSNRITRFGARESLYLNTRKKDFGIYV